MNHYVTGVRERCPTSGHDYKKADFFNCTAVSCEEYSLKLSKLDGEMGILLRDQLRRFINKFDETVSVFITRNYDAVGKNDRGCTPNPQFFCKFNIVIDYSGFTGRFW